MYVILDKQGLLWMAPVLMMYEQSASLSLRNLAKLGQVVLGCVPFDTDRVGYLKKLKALDQRVGADDQVWPAGCVPDDLVQPLFEAVEEAKDEVAAGVAGLHGGSGLGDFEDLVSGLKGHDAGGVKQREIESMVSACRDKNMMTLPGSDQSRPGVAVLTGFRHAFKPKAKPGSLEVVPRLTWPTLDVARIDNEAGQKMVKDGADVSAVVAGYEAFIFGCLVIGHDEDVPTGHMVLAPLEDSTIKVGAKLVDELSLKLHLQVLRDKVRLGGFDPTKLRQALESFNNTGSW